MKLCQTVRCPLSDLDHDVEMVDDEFAHDWVDEFVDDEEEEQPMILDDTCVTGQDQSQTRQAEILAPSKPVVSMNLQSAQEISTERQTST